MADLEVIEGALGASPTRTPRPAPQEAQEPTPEPTPTPTPRRRLIDDLGIGTPTPEPTPTPEAAPAAETAPEVLVEPTPEPVGEPPAEPPANDLDAILAGADRRRRFQILQRLLSNAPRQADLPPDVKRRIAAARGAEGGAFDRAEQAARILVEAGLVDPRQVATR